VNGSLAALIALSAARQSQTFRLPSGAGCMVCPIFCISEIARMAQESKLTPLPGLFILFSCILRVNAVVVAPSQLVLWS
jgi:hypothetical protein